MERADNLANIKKRYLQLHPVNSTSGNTYSFKRGLPLIKFDISSSMVPLLLDGAALRLSGRLTAKQGQNAGANINPNEINFIDNFAGVNHLIEMVTVSSKRLNSTLERITNYYRLCPSIISGVNSEKDIETRMGLAGNHHGTIPLTKPSLASYDAFTTNGPVATATNRKGLNFSTPIYAGIFQSGQDIDLSINSTGGLVIEILLRSDVGTIFGANASANLASYELSDLVLTAPVYEMGGNMNEGGVSQYNFNSWSSMFQTINSSTSVIALTPGLKRVSSCLINTITASDLGDQRFNACRLGGIGEVNSLRWSKNGALFPLQYRLQTVNESNNRQALIAGQTANSYHTFRVNADILRNYLEGLTTDKYNKVKNTMCSYNSWAAGCIDRDQNSGRTGTTPGTADGFSILYDGYGAGIDFGQVVWSVELQASGTSNLEVGNVNNKNCIDGTPSTAQAATVFFLNKNTLMMSPTGINVER